MYVTHRHTNKYTHTSEGRNERTRFILSMVATLTRRLVIDLIFSDTLHVILIYIAVYVSIATTANISLGCLKIHKHR